MKANKIESFWTQHPLVRTLAYMIGISLAILIVVFIGIKIYARQGDEVELPDMEGRLLDEIMEEDNLELRFVILDSVYKAGTPGGIIIYQDPKGGSMIKTGRKVYVTLSSYKMDDCEVPEITDLALKPAMSRLRNAGLEPGVLTYTESEFATVLEAYHNGNKVFTGQKLPHGSKIDLVVGTGDNTKLASIPFLLGETLEKASRTLLGASLNVGNVHYDSNVKNKEKAVIYQQEPEYTGLSDYSLGTSVELWLKEMTTEEITQMKREFRVDSSKIKDNDLNNVIVDLINEEDEGWSVEW